MMLNSRDNSNETAFKKLFPHQVQKNLE